MFHMKATLFRTTRWDVQLFLPARRSIQRKGESHWTSWVIIGANLGWFGFRFELLPKRHA